MSYQDDNYRDNFGDSRDDRDRYDDRFQDDRDRDERERTGAPGQPQKKGCSKGCLYGMAGCGCLTVLVLAALGFGGWAVWDMVQKGSSTDPAAIRAGTLEMAEINPPAGLEPKIMIDLIAIKSIVYQSKDGNSVLVLVRPHPQLDKKEEMDLDELPIAMAGKESGVKEQEMSIEKSETRDIKIRGQATPIAFSEAKNAHGEEYRIVDGIFRGKSGRVKIYLHQPVKDYDEATVTKFLESIK